MKTQWTEDEIRSVRDKIKKVSDDLKYLSDFYSHPALSTNISVSFRVASIALGTLAEIVEGERWELKEADPRSGDYGMQWYMRAKP
jgi:hypothetical protein